MFICVLVKASVCIICTLSIQIQRTVCVRVCVRACVCLVAVNIMLKVLAFSSPGSSRDVSKGFYSLASRNRVS